MHFDRVAQRLIAMNPIVVHTAALSARQISGFGQVCDNSLHSPLGDTDSGGNIAQAAIR